MPIELIDVTHIYNPGSPYEKKALDGITLTIPDGAFVGLIGHTGSGKSTLIQHFNALLKPTSGQVLVDGADVQGDKSKLKSIRQKVGLVFQYPEHQLFETTVKKDVAFGPGNLGLSAAEIEERSVAALRGVGLPEELWEKSPFDLSGGEKRRAAIAGVLAMAPKVLVLDEPTAGLDPRGRDEILAQIGRMKEERGISVVLVSHSMEDVARLVGRVIVMDQGTIRYDGAPAEVFDHGKELAEIGLAVPQIATLCEMLRGKGFDIPEGVFTVEGAEREILRAMGKGSVTGEGPY